MAAQAPFDAEKRFGDLRKRREATRSQPYDRKRLIIETSLETGRLDRSSTRTKAEQA
jgi:hypothetical protein